MDTGRRFHVQKALSKTRSKIWLQTNLLQDSDQFIFVEIIIIDLYLFATQNVLRLDPPLAQNNLLSVIVCLGISCDFSFVRLKRITSHLGS